MYVNTISYKKYKYTRSSHTYQQQKKHLMVICKALGNGQFFGLSETVSEKERETWYKGKQKHPVL